ncbi:MAG: hypothetical protein ACYC27_12495 [Armatimonadota bacterium]
MHKLVEIDDLIPESTLKQCILETPEKTVILPVNHTENLEIKEANLIVCTNTAGEADNSTVEVVEQEFIEGQSVSSILLPSRSLKVREHRPVSRVICGACKPVGAFCRSYSSSKGFGSTQINHFSKSCLL